MNSIGYLTSNATQILFSALPQEGVASALTAVSQSTSQIVGSIPGSVFALGAAAGGFAFWRQIQKEPAPVNIQDKNLALAYLQEGRLSLGQLPHFSNDAEIVRAALKRDPFAIRHAGKTLREEAGFREIVMEAVAAYTHLYRNEDNIVSRALNSIYLWRNGPLMQYLPEFQNDYEIFHSLALLNIREIQYASQELYQDPVFREFVISRIQNDPFILEYAKELCDDYEIVGMAIAHMPSALAFAGEELRQRPEFNHLKHIAYLRTTIVAGDEVIRDSISYEDAVLLVRKNPYLSLDHIIDRWLNEYQRLNPSQICEKPELSLEGDKESVLKLFLQRVREVKDYRDGGQSRAGIIERVYQMLHLASQNVEFREDLIALLTEAQTDCDDNPLIRLNDIEVMSHFYGNELSDEEFRRLALGAERYERLKQYVLSHHPGHEELETLLYLQIHLKDDLDLPITTRKMGHESYANVTPKKLSEARDAISSLSDEDLLSTSSYWEKRMATKQKEALAKIDLEYGILVNDLGSHFEEDYESIQKPQELKGFLDYAKDKGIANEYSALCDFVMAEKSRAIANIR